MNCPRKIWFSRVGGFRKFTCEWMAGQKQKLVEIRVTQRNKKQEDVESHNHIHPEKTWYIKNEKIYIVKYTFKNIISLSILI